MVADFYPFFMECSMNETDELRKRIFVNLALCKGGGHVVRKGKTGYLCIGNAHEFKIPTAYDKKDHLRLVKDMARGNND